MKRALIITISFLVIAGVVTAGVLARGRGSSDTGYRLVEVSRGDVVQTVSATGSLSAVRTVQVGTQVSGQIAWIGADFNDHVRRGQVIAVLDSTLLAQAVEQAQTDLDKARADVDQTHYIASQDEALHAQGSITDTDYHTALYNADVAKTQLQSAQVALNRARQNLGYATIRSPIDGIVIQRDVDVGQTVAASLQAPQLFLIAEDLRKMQILASVDESDIGMIADGQPVQFTVEAYPNRTFAGTVQQVRLESTTVDNVVNYTVVVAVDNADGVLLPGMTATVNFQVAHATDVLRVPNAALRFRPTDAMLAAARAERAAAGDTSSSAAAGHTGHRGGGGPGGGPGGGGRSAKGSTPSGAATLWVLDAAGKPTPMRVHLGITDGQNTQISGSGVSDGLKVIAGVTTGANVVEPTASSSPFQGSQAGGRFRGGGF